jgi:hypothetical protein
MDLVARELVDELVTRAGNPDQPFGLYLIAGDDPASELGRDVEREVFLEFFGNSRELLADEYGAYDPSSIFLVVVDHTRLVSAGVLRLIMPSTVGLKTVHDLEEVWGVPFAEACERAGITTDPARLWDVSTIAVRPEYRGSATDGLISAACLQGVIQVGRACGVEYYVTTLDMIVLKLVQELCSRPLSPFPGVEPMRYLDSPASVPLYLDMDSYCSRLRSEEPAAAATWVDGRGFEAAMSTPDWTAAEVIRRSRAAAGAESPTPAG